MLLKYCRLNVGAQVAPPRVADTIQQIFIKTRGLTICNADSHAAGVRYELAETFPPSAVAHPCEYSFSAVSQICCMAAVKKMPIGKLGASQKLRHRGTRNREFTLQQFEIYSEMHPGIQWEIMGKL